MQILGHSIKISISTIKLKMPIIINLNINHIMLNNNSKIMGEGLDISLISRLKGSLEREDLVAPLHSEL
jgi:hypothetical protein